MEPTWRGIAECAVTGWGEQEMLRGAYMAGIEIAECAVTGWVEQEMLRGAYMAGDCRVCGNGMGRTGDVTWSLHGGD